MNLNIPEATDDDKKHGWAIEFEFLDLVQDFAQSKGAEVSIEDVEMVILSVKDILSAEK